MLKNMPKDIMKKFIIALIGFLISVSLFISSGIAFGWFAQNRQVTSTGMRLALDAGSFEIWVDGTSVYEAKDEKGDDIYRGISYMKGYLGDQAYPSNISETTPSDSGIALELVNEVINPADNTKYLRPGTYGTLTFFILPKAGETVTSFRFSLDRKGFEFEFDNAEVSGVRPYLGVAPEDTPEEDREEVLEQDREIVNDLLKGHLLFFATRENIGTNGNPNYRYADLIEDDFLIDLTEREPTTKGGKTAYEITLYWAWPLTYDNIVNPEKYKLTSSGDTGLASYVAEHPEYFYEGERNSADRVAMNDAYNDADQKIGEALDYFAVYLVITQS